MKIKVKFCPSSKNRFIVGYAFVTLGDRMVGKRYAIYRGSNYFLQNSIDQATALAVEAAVQLSNERGIEFTIYDIDYAGLRVIESLAA